MKNIIRLIIILLVIVILVPTCVNASSQFECYTTGADAEVLSYGIYWLSQTFTPSTNHTITSVKLLLYRSGNPGTLNVAVKATSSGHPTGADLCVGSTNADTLTTNSSGEWREITLGAGASLTAGTKYAIVWYLSGGDASNNVKAKCDNSSSSYSGGTAEASYDSGSSWTTTSTRDFLFEEWGDVVSSPPTVATQSASSISYTTATLNGNISDFGTATSAVVSFEYGLTTSYGSTVTADESPVSATGAFSASITGLDGGTLYHFRAKVDADDTDPVYGDDVTFTTLSQNPTVTTSAASSLTMDKDGVTGGTFNGNLTSLGDNTEVNVSFIYGTTSACADGETTPATVTETGTFSNSLEFPDDWTPGGTYYYKSKAVGDTYTTPQYGSAQSIVFTMPTFTTEDADYTSPGTATATLNGNISSLGVATDCYGYFEWGYTTSYGNETTPQTLNATGDFDDSISGFLRNTTIHYRAVIKVGATTVNGSDQTFLIAPTDLTEVLWYQPNSIINGTILPDRAETEDGVITWGANPEGITSSTGVLLSTGSIGASTKEQHDTAPAIGIDMAGIDEEQDDFILISIFNPIAELTDYPLWFLFLLLGLVCTVIVMMYVQKHLQNQLFTSAAGLIVIFIFYKLGIFDWWMFFVPVVFFISIIVMERKPSL